MNTASIDQARYTPAEVAAGVARSEITARADGVYWLEHRYDEGRSCVMRASPGQAPRELTDAGVDVGTLAWEYGGGSYMATEHGVVYSDRDDQRLYLIATGAAEVVLTPPAPEQRGDRYADGCASPDGSWAAYVRESHRSGWPVRHAIVAVSLDASWAPRELASEGDFCSAPRISPDGSQLAWISWSKPRMPWDGTDLWLAGIGPGISLTRPRRIAGSTTESVLAPSWSPDGTLHWVSDRSGWWNLYALRDGQPRALCPERAEYAVAPWQHGRRSYGFLADGTLIAVRVRDGMHELVRVDSTSSRAQPIGPRTPSITDGHCSCHGTTVAFAGASELDEERVLSLDVRTGQTATLAGGEQLRDPDAISVGVPISFGGREGETVHGFWYGRTKVAGPAGPPPLILHLHGGPTDCARLALDPELQMWTSRGFALLDLNYSGSTGFGSAYRHRLDGAWGERDLGDCVAGVTHLVAEGMIDPERVFVRGASAGGYLTLCCVTATGMFRGGASRCGIADLALWRDDTHDFESRYADLLVGPDPRSATYAERSPARNVTAAASPLLLVHGLADTVVPPGHTTAMAGAYQAAGRPCEVELLADEPHGLRRAESRRRWLARELEFVESLGSRT